MEGNFKKWEKVLQKILNIIKYIEQCCEEARSPRWAPWGRVEQVAQPTLQILFYAVKCSKFKKGR